MKEKGDFNTKKTDYDQSVQETEDLDSKLKKLEPSYDWSSRDFRAEFPSELRNFFGFVYKYFEQSKLMSKSIIALGKLRLERVQVLQAKTVKMKKNETDLEDLKNELESLVNAIEDYIKTKDELINLIEYIYSKDKKIDGMREYWNKRPSPFPQVLHF